MITLINKTQKPISDYLGILSSLFCLAHCLITPAILSFHMMYNKNSSSYEIIEFIFLFISFVAVYFSSKKFNGIFGKSMMWLTFSVFALSIIFHDLLPSLVSYIASAFLIVLHFLNIYLNKSVPKYK